MSTSGLSLGFLHICSWHYALSFSCSSSVQVNAVCWNLNAWVADVGVILLSTSAEPRDRSHRNTTDSVPQTGELRAMTF